MDRGAGVGCQPQATPLAAGGRRRALVALPLIAGLAMALLIYLTGWWRHLSLEELRERRHALTAFVQAHPVLSVEVYVAAYAAVVAFSIPGALLMSLSGGYLFGVWEGAAAAVAGASAGATAMFLVARTAFGDALARRLDVRTGVLSRLQEGARAHAFSTLLALRLMPAAPIVLVTLLAGAVRMRLLPFVLATVIGITPSTLIYCWTGEGLHALFKTSGAIDPHALVRPAVYGPLVGLALLASAPLLWRLRSARRRHADG